MNDYEYTMQWYGALIGGTYQMTSELLTSDQIQALIGDYLEYMEARPDTMTPTKEVVKHKMV